jgi:hypothetical protein
MLEKFLLGRMRETGSADFLWWEVAGFIGGRTGSARSVLN